ncbi:MAG: hypothetical protein ACO3BB_00110 [Bacilli bacterium]
MIIKKWSGSAWVAESPKVTYTDIVADVTAETPASIFSAGKLKEDYLPVSVFGGMKFVGSFGISGTPTSPMELKTLISGNNTNGYAVTTNLDTFTGLTYPGGYENIGNRYVGHYWVATSNFTVFDATTSTPSTDFSSATFDDGVVPLDVPTTFIGKHVPVEAGDWLIITGWDNTNSTFIFSVINNTYTVASASAYGVVKLGYTTSSKNYAIQSTNDGLYVNVPWENTTYSAGSGIALNGSNEFSVAAGVGLTQEASGLKMTQPFIAGNSTPAEAYRVTNNIWFDLT